MILRPYQQEAHDCIQAGWQQWRRSILLLELHSGVRNAAVSLNAKATAPPHMQAPRKLHDAHLA